jgi:hypothetical protein
LASASGIERPAARISAYGAAREKLFAIDLVGVGLPTGDEQCADMLYHEERPQHDGARDRALNELGWCVVRVTEQHVFGDLEKVVALITECARCLATWAP